MTVEPVEKSRKEVDLQVTPAMTVFGCDGNLADVGA
jgi:hypothetical protein